MIDGLLSSLSSDFDYFMDESKDGCARALTPYAMSACDHASPSHWVPLLVVDVPFGQSVKKYSAHVIITDLCRHILHSTEILQA